MKVEYDKYYQTANLFGEPYAELLDFYSVVENKVGLLDLGCGQGRDAIPLARLGYTVTGVDHSEVGIEQLNEVAKNEGLPLKGFVDDIYAYNDFGKFDFILLDSMFHFGKNEKEKEVQFLNRILQKATLGTLITICIQKTGGKLAILNTIIRNQVDIEPVDSTELLYEFKDSESGHSSISKYEMVTVKKVKGGTI